MRRIFFSTLLALVLIVPAMLGEARERVVISSEPSAAFPADPYANDTCPDIPWDADGEDQEESYNNENSEGNEERDEELPAQLIDNHMYEGIAPKRRGKKGQTEEQADGYSEEDGECEEEPVETELEADDVESHEESVEADDGESHEEAEQEENSFIAEDPEIEASSDMESIPDTDPAEESRGFGERETETAESQEGRQYIQTQYDGKLASADAPVQIDISHVNEGWVGASVISDRRIKFQVVYNGEKKNYDCPTDGTPFMVELTSGSGEYMARVMRCEEGMLYSEIGAITFYAHMEDPGDIYLMSDSYLSFSEDDECVQIAAELRKESSCDAEFVSKVQEYLTRYPYEVKDVGKGYVPDVDALLEDGCGFCMEYTFTLAAMLRSQGVPAKVIYGYIDSGVYHARNEVFIDHGGEYGGYSFKDGWNVIDVTWYAYGYSQDMIMGAGFEMDEER